MTLLILYLIVAAVVTFKLRGTEEGIGDFIACAIMGLLWPVMLVILLLALVLGGTS